MKKIIIYLIGIISALSVGAQSRPLGDDHGGHDATGRLRHGHYTGFFIVDKQEHAFALQADFFVLSPDDRTFFPKLNAILKLGLGGYNTKEYVTQAYKNVRYDFDNHILILDEPLSDFVITAQVHNISGRTHMKGSVWIRSAAKQAQFILESDTVDSSALTQPLVSNATAVDSGDDNEDISFVPLLRGQYEGKCEGKSAVLQLQTMKGLRIQDPRSGNFLFDYEVVGQIGYRRTDEHRTAQRPWDVYGSFAGGVYDLFSGKLFFLGPASSTLDCQRTGSKLTCRFLSRDGEIPCSFELTHSSINSKAQSYSRDFHINPSEEQLKDLPPVAPPSSQELARALDGSFVGYIHHELNNHYQPMNLQIVASTSSDNPHNPNNLFISATSVIHYGKTFSELFISNRFEPRAFYLTPGFALSAPNSDAFILIEEWKLGYIKGVWYSESFGRVGTIELVKAKTLPDLPKGALFYPLWHGKFQGPMNVTKEKPYRWLQIIMPNQPSERLESTISFVGSYLSSEISTIKPMERGRLDPYTGAIGWLFAANNGIGMVAGNLEDDGSLSLYWPPAPNVFMTTMGPYKLDKFKIK